MVYEASLWQRHVTYFVELQTAYDKTSVQNLLLNGSMFFFFLFIREASNSFLRTHWMPKFTKLKTNLTSLSFIKQINTIIHCINTFFFFLQPFTEQSVLIHSIILPVIVLASCSCQIFMKNSICIHNNVFRMF